MLLFALTPDRPDFDPNPSPPLITCCSSFSLPALNILNVSFTAEYLSPSPCLLPIPLHFRIWNRRRRSKKTNKQKTCPHYFHSPRRRKEKK